MRKFSVLIALFTLFLIQPSFAAMMGDDDLASKPCMAVAEACKNAGFTDEGMGDKSFWFGCMKPVLHNKAVSGITLDKKEVKECRQAKIARMKRELKELQAVK